MSDPVGITFIMPAFNEADSLADTIERTLACGRGLAVRFEIAVVNDGSSDTTGELAEELGRRHEAVRVFHHVENQGIGGAIRRGIREARGEFMIIAPADNPLEAELVNTFLDAGAGCDLVLGYREERVGYNPLMRFNSWFFHVLTRRLLGLPYRDVNWIQLYRRSLFDRFDLAYSGVAMGAEVVFKAHAAGMRIREIPCPMTQRTRGTASAGRVGVMVRTAGEFLRLVGQAPAIRRRLSRAQDA